MGDDGKFGRAICPQCQRVISGRFIGYPFTDRPRKIELLRHKNLTRTAYCNGGRKVIDAMPEVSDHA
jgi:hypothetical protein